MKDCLACAFCAVVFGAFGWLIFGAVLIFGAFFGVLTFGVGLGTLTFGTELTLGATLGAEKLLPPLKLAAKDIAGNRRPIG